VGPHTDDILAGGTVTAFNLVILNSSGKWVHTDANSSATYSGMIGLSLESKNADEAMSTALPGSYIRNDSWSWTPGATLWMSETAGAITATAPTTTDAARRIVGFALTDDMIYFDPSNDWVTHV
jgi:hypothetical protein